jgi:hypothetical protein
MTDEKIYIPADGPIRAALDNAARRSKITTQKLVAMILADWTLKNTSGEEPVASAKL